MVAELGVLHWVLDADNYETDPDLAQIRKDRSYDYHVSFLPASFLLNFSYTFAII